MTPVIATVRRTSIGPAATGCCLDKVVVVVPLDDIIIGIVTTALPAGDGGLGTSGRGSPPDLIVTCVADRVPGNLYLICVGTI